MSEPTSPLLALLVVKATNEGREQPQEDGQSEGHEAVHLDFPPQHGLTQCLGLVAELLGALLQLLRPVHQHVELFPTREDGVNILHHDIFHLVDLATHIPKVVCAGTVPVLHLGAEHLPKLLVEAIGNGLADLVASVHLCKLGLDIFQECKGYAGLGVVAHGHEQHTVLAHEVVRDACVVCLV